ncbi:ParB/RepB/Spo0J family partition protein [Vibrio harveyi]|uniref:ParB/RepB/Spo0J family partition protein n=1 Tax=Vibrio harveyi TaxID=669 RepID=UPI001EFCC68A|nr:ParB/RepB/Spo0J family partition protein [Vibrio harveyi]MCG9589876.1 ParB/RepB/Spo0J family partition protein [Vibrio harveyi]MCG9670272.1 ParB/RepB/Spo0J family partition protein [Vibrio harveyi]
MNTPRKLDPISTLASLNTRATSGSGNKYSIVERLLKDIVPDPEQPRKDMDMDSIGELAESIKSTGRLIQPIVIRDNPNGKGYMIVAGERRWRACNLLKWTHISTIHRDAFKSETLSQEALTLILQLAENLGREEMTPYDTAAALSKAKEEYDLSYDALAAMLSKKKSTVHELMRVYNGPIFIKKLFKNGVKQRPLLILTKLAEVDEKFVQDHINSQLEKGGKISLAFAESLKSMLQQNESDSSDDSLIDDELNNTDVSGLPEGDGSEVVQQPTSNDSDCQQNDMVESDLDKSDSVTDDNVTTNNESEGNDTSFEETGSVNLEVNDPAFKKRSVSKALVSLKTPKGDGTLCLEYAPLNPTEVCVELTDGHIISVPFIECSIIGYE